MTAKASVFIATSLDGYIARKDGGLPYSDYYRTTFHSPTKKPYLTPSTLSNSSTRYHKISHLLIANLPEV